jgi:hypothetical protein
MKRPKQSLVLINFGRRKGRKSRLAAARRRVATTNESTPTKALPIKPKEKAQRSETIAK